LLIKRYKPYYIYYRDITVIAPVSNLSVQEADTSTISPRADFELDSLVNRAASNPTNFALVLAMLEQNYLHRPVFPKDKLAESFKTESVSHNYRSCPLHAEQDHWDKINQTSYFIKEGQIQTAQLWLAMHPEPLSQFNDPLHLNAEIVANCSLPTQDRLKTSGPHALDVDETGLYELLEAI
jgi:hypothetical protein